MKKYFLIALAALLLVGCQKNNQDSSQKPSIAWQANDSFSEMEIVKDMDAKLALSVPEGVSSFQITLSIPSTLVGVANKMIGNSSNKGTAGKEPVMDLVNDATASSALTQMGFLSGSPKTGTAFTLDFTKLLEELASDSPLDNASKFSFRISVTDKAQNTLSKDVRFNWTSGPEVELTSNNSLPYSLVRGGSEALVIKVTAFGKIAGLTFSLENCTDEGILNYIKRRSGTSSAVIDLMNESTSSAFNLPAAKDLKGKTSVELTLTSLMQNFSYEASSTGTSMSFVVKVADELGKEAAFSFALAVPVPAS